MKRIIFIGVIIISATVLLSIILLTGRSPFGKNNSSFASEPKGEITKIEFSDGENEISLVKDDNNWLLNGKDETRKSGILFIERILTELSIKSPVSSELFDKEIVEKNIQPVKVKVYEKRKLIKSFLVYKTSSNKYGNIMKLRANSLPFIVYLPGFDGEIGSAFTMNELFWQPYNIFNLLPSEILSVKFDQLADTSDSFMISYKDHKYALSGGKGNLSGWDSARVYRYLSYFTYIPFESWALDVSTDDENLLDISNPLYRISVINFEGKETILTLWEKTDKSTAGADSDRLYGKTSGSNNFIVIRYFDIDPLIKKRSYFFPQ